MNDKDIFSTKESFLVAAASYFGLPDDQLMQGSTVEASVDGSLDVVLRVALTPDNLVGISHRMVSLAAEAQRVPESDDLRPPVGWTDEELREQYNSLDRADKSRFGSFTRYKAWRMGDVEIAEKVEKVELPPHVYLSPAEATPQQKAMAIGRDEKGNYAVAVEDLTDAQKEAHDRNDPTADALRAQYIGRTMAAHARLNGADGKPTSNADDFGGAPG